MDSGETITFLYGSFMSPKVLRKRGLGREMAPFEVATLEGFDIIFAPNATLIPSPNGIVYGVLAELTQAELSLLYSEDWLSNYEPGRVVVRNKAGHEVRAVCYIAPPHVGVSPKTGLRGPSN